eukprot:g8224.t1
MDEEGRAADADELPVCGSMLQSNQNADGFVDLQGGKSEIPRLSRAAKLSELAPGIKLRVATANGAAAGATGSGDSTSSTSSSIGGAVASASLGAVKSASSSLLGKLSSAPTATGGARPSSLAERDGEVEDEEELDGEGAGKPEGTGPDGTRHRKKDKAGTDADGSPDHVGDDGEVDTDGGRSESSLITKRAIIQSLLEMKQKMAADVEDDREEERSDPENVTEMSRDPEQEVPVREITSEPAEEVDAATATIGTTTSGSSTTADSELRQRLVKNKVLVISPTNSDSSLDDEAARTGDNSVIAALYGHDVNTPRVQHEILTCLVPQGSPEEMGTPADNTSVLLTDTAGKVAKAIIKNAVERATGLRLCADVVELATLMYNLYTPASQNKIEDDSGFVHVGCTPTATARQYFRPKMLNQINHVYVPLLLMGCIANQIAQMLDLLFASSWWLILPVLGGTSGLVYYSYRRVDDIASFFRTIPGYYLTVVVFGIHALMPMFSAFASMQMVMPFCLHALDWSSSFEEFSVFLLGSGPFIEKFVQRWNFLLLPINPRGGTGDNSADAHRLLKRTVHCILLLRRMFLIGCGCVFAIYSVAWMEYLGGALFLGAGQRGLMLGKVQDQDQQDLNHDREDSQGQQQPHSAAASNKLSDEDREADWIVWEFLVRSRILMLAALSAWCQHHVTDVLRKREVLLKLVGAERILANSLCLLLNGIAIVSGTHITNVTLAEFLEKITPPAIVCCGIVAARSRSLLLGFALSLFPAIEARFLPLVNYGGSFITGVVISAWAFVILGKEYLKHGRSMEASHAYRLAYLVPGEVSDRTVAFLDEAVSRVRNRTMQYMAVNFLEKLFRFFLGKQA